MKKCPFGQEIFELNSRRRWSQKKEREAKSDFLDDDTSSVNEKKGKEN
jgi:hypothetical protein